MVNSAAGFLFSKIRGTIFTDFTDLFDCRAHRIRSNWRGRSLAARAIRAGRGRGFKGEGIAPPVAPRAASAAAKPPNIGRSNSVFKFGSHCVQYTLPL